MTNNRALSGYICVVTGATRGIGRGIALALGDEGATVYVTGRTMEPQQGRIGSLKEVAAEIGKRGGQAIPVELDHNDEEKIMQFFVRLKRDQNGRLDLWVNNAYSGVGQLAEDCLNPRDGFWHMKSVTETPGRFWDIINHISLRNAYVCSCLATKAMLEYRHEEEKPGKRSKAAISSYPVGLIVNVSSFGGITYLFNPAYTAGKAGLDRMSMDMGVELAKHQASISAISLWPGPVSTEEINQLNEAGGIKWDKQIMESPEMSGRVVAHMLKLKRKKLLALNGMIVRTAQYSRANSIQDVDKRYILPMNSIKFILIATGWKLLSNFVPSFVKIPDLFMLQRGIRLY